MSSGKKLSHWFRSFVVAACVLGVLFVAGAALAYGRVQWESTNVKPRSDGDSWNIKLTMYLPKKPDFAHMPMKFEFQPKVYYERSMVDGDKIVERKVPIQHKQPLIESVDVGFLDPRSGEIQNRTRFAFKITRERGFEVGEYLVTIRDGRNGAVIGRPTKLILGGENKVIDRRSIVFSGEKKKKKDDDMKKVEKDDAEKASIAEASGEGEPADDDSLDDLPENEQPDFGEESDPDGEIKEKPGGCGCRAPGGSAPVQGGIAALALAGALLLRRRRAA